MNELIKLWEKTKMIVLIAVCAGLYAALLIPFKMIQIIPGIAELRPAACIPIICSFFFGPAAAWGSAIGNVVADFAGQFGPGSFFGIIGNFLYGYLPYRLWRKYKKIKSKKISNVKDYLFLIFIVIVSSSVCSCTISWGLHLIGLPFYSVAWIILINNIIFGSILVPILCNWLDNRVFSWHLNYEDIMIEKEFSNQRFSSLYLVLLIVVIIVSFIIGYCHFISNIIVTFDKYCYLINNSTTAIAFIIIIFILSLLI